MGDTNRSTRALRRLAVALGLPGAAILTVCLSSPAEAQEPDYTRIRNRWTNQHVHVENGPPEIGDIAQGWWSAQWVLEPVEGTGFYRIRNRWTNQYLHAENGPLEIGDAPAGWWSAQWAFERVGTTSFHRIRNRWTDRYLNVEEGPLALGPVPSGWWSAQWEVENLPAVAQEEVAGDRPLSLFPETYTAPVSEPPQGSPVPLGGERGPFGIPALSPFFDPSSSQLCAQFIDGSYSAPSGTLLAVGIQDNADNIISIDAFTSYTIEDAGVVYGRNRADCYVRLCRGFEGSMEIQIGPSTDRYVTMVEGEDPVDFEEVVEVTTYSASIPVPFRLPADVGGGTGHVWKGDRVTGAIFAATPAIRVAFPPVSVGGYSCCASTISADEPLSNNPGCDPYALIGRIDAAGYLDEVIHLFAGDRVYQTGPQRNRQLTPGRLIADVFPGFGALGWDRIDAAVHNPDVGGGAWYFFRGLDYVRYEGGRFGPVLNIRGDAASEFATGFPGHWEAVDAAVYNPRSRTYYLFHDGEYVRKRAGAAIEPPRRTQGGQSGFGGLPFPTPLIDAVTFVTDIVPQCVRQGNELNSTQCRIECVMMGTFCKTPADRDLEASNTYRFFSGPRYAMKKYGEDYGAFAFSPLVPEEGYISDVFPPSRMLLEAPPPPAAPAATSPSTPPAAAGRADLFQLVALHSAKCLDVNEISAENGALVQQWDCVGPQHLNQIWSIRPVNGEAPGSERPLNGTYTLVAEHSGKCLDVSQVSTADGAAVHQWECLGSGQPNQVWTIRPVSGRPGVYTLAATHSGKCLDVWADSGENGAGVVQWPCGGPDKLNQLWRIRRPR